MSCLARFNLQTFRAPHGAAKDCERNSRLPPLIKVTPTAIDLDQEPYRTNLGQSDITVLNLIKLSSDDILNHGKFTESPEVVQIIGRQLAGRQILILGSAWAM
jgi:hypothetical protein